MWSSRSGEQCRVGRRVDGSNEDDEKSGFRSFSFAFGGLVSICTSRDAADGVGTSLREFNKERKRPVGLVPQLPTLSLKKTADLSSVRPSSLLSLVSC